MREYAEIFAFLIPAHGKRNNKASDAIWRERKELTEREIHQAIYYGLPLPYQEDLESHYQKDYQEMDWNEFLNALLSYEVIDDRNKKKKEASRAQLKAEKKQNHDIKIKKKRKSTDANATTSETEKKRPHKHCTSLDSQR